MTNNIFPQKYFVPDTVTDDYVDDNSDPLWRVYAQYRDKPSLVAWMRICTLLGANIYQTAQLLRKSYDIDNVGTELLNVIGRIVVLSRSYMAPVKLSPPFVASAQNSPWTVGVFSQQLSALSSDQDSAMSDEFYRLGIRAKIVKNNTDATIEDVLAGASFLLAGATILRVVDNEDMTFSIEYTGDISDVEAYAIANASLVPTPQGVNFKGFVKVDS